jgi:hypothetical protein
LLTPLRIFKYPTDLSCERPGIEWLRQCACHLIFNDVGQAADVERHHWGAAGVGFEACVVEGAQAEVVVQVAGVVRGEAELER